jgi:cell wall-associated NlpC family hydrolase
MVEVSQQKAVFYASMNADVEPSLVLPFECRLESEDPFSPASWLKIKLPDATELFVQKKEITSELQPKSKDQLAAFSKEFVGIPFKQAGTTSFGFDSAGLMQMLYRQMGVFLPRSVQAQCDYSELEPAALDCLEPGDLLFWGSSAERMDHVAMLLDNHQCIHVNPYEGVQIASLHAVSNLSVRVGRRLR